MIKSLVEGFFLGMTVAIIVGPAMIALVQTSIKYGVWHGMYLALGIFSSDLTIVVGSYFGASQILGNPKSHLVLGIIGGCILLLFGIGTLIRKVPETETVEAIRELKFAKGGFFTYFFKGYFLNMANPSIWFFWITSVVAINASYGGNHNKVAFFFAGTLLMVLMTDILKVFLANKIRTAISPQVKVWINRIAGILFLIIGLFVIGSSISEYFYGISLIKGQLTQ
ncbi:MAG: LysE family translocator [Bacteroidetes bacterium]|nr:MAG: LysE family translocator [Bacteroidota bacterium]